MTFLLRLLVIFLLSGHLAECANIGVLVVATGKYIEFVKPLVSSAQNHFCKGHHVTYIVFTDQKAEPLPNTVYIFYPKQGWPFDTMNRYYAYYNHWDLLKNQDYLFAIDADMLFVADVGDEVLGERVATQHPGFIDSRGSYETNPLSKAFVGKDEGACYFAGGVYGGTSEAFFHMLTTNIKHVEEDLKNGIIAVWHDESHWNRYCIDYPPTVVLPPSYCYPESWSLNCPKKILALDKNHADMRQ